MYARKTQPGSVAVVKLNTVSPPSVPKVCMAGIQWSYCKVDGSSVPYNCLVCFEVQNVVSCTAIV